MEATDKAQFLKVLAGVYDFYGKEFSKFAARVWWQACQSFDAEQCSAALSAHLMDPENGQFMPKPADIVRVLQGTQTDRAQVAWGKVMDAIRAVGSWQSVAFDDGLIHAVVDDLGGWSTVCASTIDELPFLSRRFTDAYRAYARRPAAAYPCWLPGVAELENKGSGQPIAPPTLVGDPVRARQVMEGGTAGPKTAITQASSALALPRSPVKSIAA